MSRSSLVFSDTSDRIFTHGCRERNNVEEDGDDPSHAASRQIAAASDVSVRLSQPPVPLFSLLSSSSSVKTFPHLVGRASTRRLFRGENNGMRVEKSPPLVIHGEQPKYFFFFSPVGRAACSKDNVSPSGDNLRRR